MAVTSVQVLFIFLVNFMLLLDCYFYEHGTLITMSQKGVTSCMLGLLSASPVTSMLSVIFQKFMK